MEGLRRTRWRGGQISNPSGEERRACHRKSSRYSDLLSGAGIGGHRRLAYGACPATVVTLSGTLEFPTQEGKHFLIRPGSGLGAPPGASTAALIAISVLQKCFPDELTPSAWLPKLKEVILSYGVSLINHGDLLRGVRADTAAGEI
jgi:Malate:quinone oxidoreductase (Mqo)